MVEKLAVAWLKKSPQPGRKISRCTVAKLFKDGQNISRCTGSLTNVKFAIKKFASFLLGDLTYYTFENTKCSSGEDSKQLAKRQHAGTSKLCRFF